MKALLFVVGLILVVVGGTTGYVSQIDYGKALIGLNLGLAATLLVGGFVIIGLAAVIGAISRLADDMPKILPISGNKISSNIGPAQTIAPMTPPKRDNEDMPFPAATVAVGATAGAIGSAFDNADKGVDAGIDKVAEAARAAANEAKEIVVEAGDTTSEAANKTSESFGDLVNKAKEKTQNAAETADEAIDTVADAAGDAKDAVTETVEGAVDAAEEAVVDATGKTDDADDTETDKGKTSKTETSDETALENKDEPGETVSDDEDENTGDGAGESENGDQLYIVEEVEIRGKSARVLSDNTVEAETAEGWMRFENIEHLEEYLDAMEA